MVTGDFTTFAPCSVTMPRSRSSRQLRERDGRLLRVVVEAGAVLLLRRDALELVLLAALLAAHAAVAVEAAERQPLAAGHLDARLARRHDRKLVGGLRDGSP